MAHVTSGPSTAAAKPALSRLRSLRLIMLGCLMMLGLQGLVAWRAHVELMASTDTALINLAAALAQHADDTIDIADRVLFGVAIQAGATATSPLGHEHLQEYLNAQKAALIRIRDIAVTGSDGSTLASSATMAGIGSPSQAYFRRQRDDPALGLYISLPLRDTATGQWVITISRRYQSADGGFGGIVFAVIDLSYFSDYYATYDLGANSAVALAAASGELLARYPKKDQFIGQYAPSRLFHPGSGAANGSFQEVSPLDGIRRIVGFRRSQRYPLLVAVSIAREQALTGWRVSAQTHLAAATILTLVIALLAVRLMRQTARGQSAEARLRESEERYRLIADHASDIVTRVGRDGQRTYVSNAARRILGVDPKDLLGTRLIDFVHPDDRADMRARVARLVTGHTEDQAPTFRVIRPDGGQVWLEASTRLMTDPETGAPDGYVSVLRDITKRVAAEAAMHESEERFRLLLQSSGVTEALYMLDPTGHVVTWNAAAEKIKGYKPNEIIGQHFSKFFTPEDIANGEPDRSLVVARETGQHVTEGWRVRKDGSRFLAHVATDAIYWEDGTLRGFAKVTHDITTKRIEEEQRAIIIEAAPTGMIIVDESGIITLANAQVEQLFGYPSGTLKGQPADVLVPNVFDPANIDETWATTPGRQCSGRRRDGSLVPIEVILRLVETPRGEIIVASLIDITERLRRAKEEREAEARARQEIEATNANLSRLSRHLAKARDRANLASEAKSRFLAGMSHELRTPLNGILGYAQLLQMEGGLNAMQAARVEAMLQAGQHLLQMITGVLDLSEIEAEHVALRAVELNMHAMAEVCLNVVRPDADRKGLKLRIDLDPATPRKIVADPSRLRQILVNLLGNAVKFTAAGSIALRLRPGSSADAIRIEVADTGIGIPADKRDRLFQAFERLDIETSRTIEGAGLGLALSARLAGLMGGRLEHEDNQGGGSVFWLELPLAPPGVAAGTPADPPAQSDIAPAPPRSLNVLVVDDVAMNREIAAACLCAAGHRATQVSSAPEAVATAAADDFDVILMDVRMPGMDGLEATRRIRALDGPRGRVPIVALTAQVFTAQIEACRVAGMDSHVAKPFDKDTLLAAVVGAFRRGHAPRATQSAPPPAPKAGPQVVNSEAFQRTVSALTEATLKQYLGSVILASETLLRDLRDPNSLSRDGQALADAAHSLAGSASVFGFERLAAASQQFENGVQAASPQVADLAGTLIAAIEATLREIDDWVPRGEAPPPGSADAAIQGSTGAPPPASTGAPPTASTEAPPPEQTKMSPPG